MTDTIDTIDLEIARLQGEAEAVRAAPQSFDEAWPLTEREWFEAEAAFREFGAMLGGPPAVFPETAERRRLVEFGAHMIDPTHKKAILQSERDRIQAETRNGISAADKQRRLADLERTIKGAVAKRVLLIRASGAKAFEAPPPVVHSWLACGKQSYLEQLAAG